MKVLLGAILGSLGTGGVLIYLIANPDKFQKWVSMIYWLLSKIWERYEYLAIKTEVQGKLNSFVGKMQSKLGINFPRIVIQWAATDGGDLIWEDDEVILVMRDREHRNKNFVHAAYFFTSETLLKRLKYHISKTQKLSIDLYATKQLIESESRGSLEQFMTDYFIPQIEKNPAIKQLIQQYLRIDRIGIFFPIFIQEIYNLGSKVFLEEKSTNDNIIKEVKNLLDFLEKFSDREVGDTRTPDTFIGQYMRCGVKIVASRPVRERGDIKFHKERINFAIQQGLENIYLLGSDGKENIDFIQRVSSAILDEHDYIEYVGEHHFQSEIKIRGQEVKVKSCLVHLHNPKAVKFILKPTDIKNLA